MRKAIAFCAGFFVFPALAALAADAARPVLLMGDKYGRYERQRWTQKLLLPEKIVFTSSDEWVPPSRWKEFSLVVVADSSPGTLTPQNSAEVRAYLEGGGCLLTLGDGLRALLGLGVGAAFPSWTSWVGAEQVGLERGLSGYALETKTFPFVQAKGPKPGGWGSDLLTLSKLKGAKVVIGSGGKAVVAVNPVGKGAFIFDGPLFFRTLGAGEREETSTRRADQLEASLKRTQDALERKKLEGRIATLKKQAEVANKENVHDAESLEAMLAAALTAIAPLTEKGQAAASLDRVAGSGGTPLIAWQREPISDVSVYAFGEMVDGPVFSPAGPAPGEVLREVTVNLGAAETLACAINLTAAADSAGVEAALGELKSSNGATFSHAGVEIFRQTRLRTPKVSGHPEDPAECAFWLLPAARFDLKRAETTILWLRFRSKGVPPGTYRGEVLLKGSAGETRLPLAITVWKVSPPAKPEIMLGLYGYYWLAPFPSKYSNALDGAAQAPTDLTRALAILDDAVEHGCRDASDTTLDIRRVRVRASGRTLDSLCAKGGAKPAEPFAADGNVPPLDFSAYDAQVEAAAKRGCFRISVRHGRGGMLSSDNNYVCRLTGEAMGLPLWDKVFTGLWKQFRDYLAGKGFNEFTFKYGDEMGPDETRQHWMPIARLAKAAGWQPEANWTGAGVNADLMNEASSLCESWSLNAHYADQFLKWRAAGTVRPPADARISFYGSWGYFKAPRAVARLAMWEAWGLGLQGLDLYTWVRQVIWDGTRVIPSAAWEGWRDGWTEANYLAILRRRAAEVAAKSPNDAWAARARKFLDTLIGPASPYGIVWTEGKSSTMPYPFRVLVGPENGLDRARRDLLALLSEAPAGGL